MLLRPGKVGTLLYSILCIRDSTRVVYKSSQNGREKNDSPGLEMDALCEFAVHAEVEKSVVEGKGKLSVIQSIRRKIEDAVEGLSDDDKI